MAVVGDARDLITTTNGSGVGAATAHLAVHLDEAGLIVSVDQFPDGPDCAPLVGARIGFGFRTAVKALLTELAGTPLGLLVDDLSGAPAPSGYGAIRERIVLGLPELRLPAAAAGAAQQQADVCSGWRSGGLALRSRQDGQPLPFAAVPPVAPVVAKSDPLGWHPMPRLGLHQSRRLRRLDVWAEEAGLLMADAMFRDSTVDPDAELTERVVHEYTLRATLELATLTITSIHADPRSLPFPSDCSLAAASADLLVGQRAPELRTKVRELSRGPVSCTHLNDLFRSLADVGELASLLSSAD